MPSLNPLNDSKKSDKTIFFFSSCAAHCPASSLSQSIAKKRSGQFLGWVIFYQGQHTSGGKLINFHSERKTLVAKSRCLIHLEPSSWKSVSKTNWQYKISQVAEFVYQMFEIVIGIDKMQSNVISHLTSHRDLQVPSGWIGEPWSADCLHELHFCPDGQFLPPPSSSSSTFFPSSLFHFLDTHALSIFYHIDCILSTIWHIGLKTDEENMKTWLIQEVVKAWIDLEILTWI